MRSLVPLLATALGLTTAAVAQPITASVVTATEVGAWVTPAFFDSIPAGTAIVGSDSVSVTNTLATGSASTSYSTAQSVRVFGLTVVTQARHSAGTAQTGRFPSHDFAEVVLTLSSPIPRTGRIVCDFRIQERIQTSGSFAEVDIGDDGLLDLGQGDSYSSTPIVLDTTPTTIRVRTKAHAVASTLSAAVRSSLRVHWLEGPCTPSSTLNWTQRLPQDVIPTTRNDLAVAYDPVDQVVLMHGGRGPTGGQRSDFFSLSGLEWTQLSTPAQFKPSARREHAMVHHSGTDRFVLFGGDTQGVVLGDTWTWNRQQWQELSLTTAPTPRSEMAMAYDAARDEIVLYGGIGGILGQGGSVLDDTWTFDGTAWSQKAPANTPPPLRNAEMVYDSARQRMVLAFGSQGLGQLNDATYVWDGSDWTMVDNGSQNLGRREFAMAYDAARDRVVVHGGEVFGAVLAEALEFDGTTWSCVDTSRSAGAVLGAKAVFDTSRQRVVLIGGADRESIGLFGPVVDPTVTANGGACSTVGVAPTHSVETPFIGNQDWALEVRSAPLAPSAIVVAGSLLPFDLFGCTVVPDLSWNILLVSVADTNGFARTSVPLPYAPALLGLSLHSQALVFEPTGFKTTDYLTSTFGD